MDLFFIYGIESGLSLKNVCNSFQKYEKALFLLLNCINEPLLLCLKCVNMKKIGGLKSL